jgi:hypothetical protein
MNSSELIEQDINICRENYEVDLENNGEYRLGMGFISDHNLLLESSFPISVFYKHDSKKVLKYLIKNSTTYPNWRKLEIIKMDFSPIPRPWFCFTCVFKTFWIRIIQRTWKKIYKQRQEILRNPGIVNFVIQRQLHCKKTLFLPGLKGMLAT